MRARGGEMGIQAFLRLLPDKVRAKLPSDLQGFQTVGPMGSLIKFHYGKPAIHYEVWVQRRTGRIELGLHFEADAESNRQYLEALSNRFFEIQAALGPDVEPEQWTASWTRVHQGLPLAYLDESLAEKISTRMAAMIKVLQPMLQAARG